MHAQKNTNKIVVVALAVILIALAVGAAIIFFGHKKSENNLSDIKIIINQVGALYLLPSNEEPALATVTDSSKLSSAFAGKVENGDRILIYEKNGKAIVYRPSINKIVAVEPVQIDAVDTLNKK
ncbi:MAG: hypothetical protein U0491_01800 [Candidatus Saccharimonadales bacterium]